jgi:cell division protein FtsL
MPASKKSLRIEAILWLAVTAVAILLSVLLLVRNAAYRADLLAIQAEKEGLTAQVADLKARCEQYEKQAQDLPGLLSWEIEELKKKGLKDPVADLVADLQDQPELIPHEGVLGGTMAFGFPEKIHVLTEHYVLAYFEDGHIGGWMVLEYSVARGGRISWRVVDSHLD